MPDTFDTLRPYLFDYLRARGIDPRRRLRCLNPDHVDRNPSMAYDARRHKVHCFACGADYDLFDLLALDNNLTSPADALSLASERYGDGSARRSVSFRTAEPSAITNRPAERAAIKLPPGVGGRSFWGVGGRIWGLRPVLFQRRASFFLLSLGLLRPPGRDPLLHPAGIVSGHRHPLPLRLRSHT